MTAGSGLGGKPQGGAMRFRWFDSAEANAPGAGGRPGFDDDIEDNDEAEKVQREAAPASASSELWA